MINKLHFVSLQSSSMAGVLLFHLSERVGSPAGLQQRHTLHRTNTTSSLCEMNLPLQIHLTGYAGIFLVIHPENVQPLSSSQTSITPPVLQPALQQR